METTAQETKGLFLYWVRPVIISCPECEGEGEIFDDELNAWVECPKCEGTGEIEKLRIIELP